MTARNPRLTTQGGRTLAKAQIIAVLEQAPPEGEYARVIAGLAGVHPLDLGELMGDLREEGHVRRTEAGAWVLVPGAPTPGAPR